MRLARSDRSSTLLSPRPARFPRRDSTPHAAQHSCAPLHSDAVFVLTGLVKRRRKRIREPCYSAAVNTILQLRAIFFLCCSLCFPFFLLFFFEGEGFPFLLFLRFVRFRDELEGGKTEKERERHAKRTSNNPFGARVTHARSAFILPAFSLQTPFTYPRYIYIYVIFSPVFRLCFSPYDERNATNDLLPVFFLSSNRRGKNFHLRT